MVANTPAFIELEVSWSGSERVLLKDQDCLAEKSRQWAAEWALPLLCVMRCNEQSWPQCYCELKRPWASLDPSNPSLRPTLKKAGSQGKHTDTHTRCSCIPVVSVHGFWDSQWSSSHAIPHSDPLSQGGQRRVTAKSETKISQKPAQNVFT